jgi:beta-lactamase regulating signal transducer with metallopeptidase domain
MGSPKQTMNIVSVNKLSIRHSVYLLLGMSVITFNACEIEPQITYVIDEPLEAYYDRFIDEAYMRGLDVEYATYQVDATIGDITTPNVIGTCSWDQTHKHSIVLDKDYWQRATDLQREFLVFHELGHCVLGKDHVDNSDASGNCISIMSSGTGDCRVVYSNSNRNRLIDELFSN